jgi:hypothetical protein
VTHLTAWLPDGILILFAEVQLEQLRNCTNENHTAFEEFQRRALVGQSPDKDNSTAASDKDASKHAKSEHNDGHSRGVATVHTTHSSRYGEVSTTHSLRRFPSIEVHGCTYLAVIITFVT